MRKSYILYHKIPQKRLFQLNNGAEKQNYLLVVVGELQKRTHQVCGFGILHHTVIVAISQPQKIVRGNLEILTENHKRV